MKPDNLTSNEYRERNTIGIDEKWEPVLFVNAAPDDGYVLRILEAHLKNATDGRFVSTDPLAEMMNKWQDERAELLRDAIKKLQG